MARILVHLLIPPIPRAPWNKNYFSSPPPNGIFFYFFTPTPNGKNNEHIRFLQKLEHHKLSEQVTNSFGRKNALLTFLDHKIKGC